MLVCLIFVHVFISGFGQSLVVKYSKNKIKGTKLLLGNLLKEGSGTYLYLEISKLLFILCVVFAYIYVKLVFM